MQDISKIFFLFILILLLNNCEKNPRIVATAGQQHITEDEMLRVLMKSYPDRDEFIDIDINDKKKLLDGLIYFKLKINNTLDSTYHNHHYYKDIENKKRQMIRFIYKEKFLVNNFVSDNYVYTCIERSNIKIKASIVLIGYKGSTKSVKRTKDEARTLAVFVSKEAKAGTDFESLVKKYSDDRSTIRNNGSTGYFKWGDKENPVEQAIWNMDPGEISDPVEGSRGFYIIRLDERVKIEGFRPRKDIHTYYDTKIKIFKKYKREAKKKLRDLYNALLDRYSFQLNSDNIKRVVDTLRVKFDRDKLKKSEFTDREKAIVLAGWEGGSITLEMVIEHAGNFFRGRFTNFLKDNSLNKYITDMAKEYIMDQDARRMGLDNNDYVNEVVKDYSEKKLARLAEIYRVNKKVKLSEDEIRAYYQKNKEQFRLTKNKIEPFNKVKKRIAAEIRKKRIDERIKIYKQELKKEYKVMINERILASL